MGTYLERVTTAELDELRGIDQGREQQGGARARARTRLEARGLIVWWVDPNPEGVYLATKWLLTGRGMRAMRTGVYLRTT